MFIRLRKWQHNKMKHKTKKLLQTLNAKLKEVLKILTQKLYKNKATKPK